MKILHLGKYYYPVDGGIESTSRYIIEALPEFEHRFICFNTDHNSKTENVGNVKVTRASTWTKVMSQPISFSYLSQLKSVIKEFKPDIIHFHHPNPLVGFYLLMTIPRDVKLVVHWHSDIIWQKSVYAMIKPVERRMLERADAIITTSPIYGAASVPLRDFQSKVSVVASAIDPKRYTFDDKTRARVAAIRKECGDRKLIYFIGRHVEYKGLEYLLKAIPLIDKNCLIVISGKGPLTQPLKEKYKYPNVRWLGRISDDELKAMLYASDIFAFPSITRNEAFGLVLTEAMYCNTPPVTFHIEGSGVNWVSVKDETGLEVANSDYKAFANAINRLLRDDFLRERLASNARKRVERNFTMDAVGPRYKQLYKSLV